MKLLDILRKLGVVRYGFRAGTYRSGKDCPYEFMSDGIYNADKETVTRDDLKHVFGRGKQPQEPVCEKCSSAIRAGAKFCGNCGAPVSEAKQPQVTADAPPPVPASGDHGTGISRGCLGGVLVCAGIVVVLIVAAMIISNNDDKVSAEDAVEHAAMEAGQQQAEDSPAKVFADGPSIHQESQGAASYSVYRNEQLGVMLEVPAHWQSEVKGQAVVFSGRDGTDEYLATINIQAVQHQAGSSLIKQSEYLVEQWKQMDGFKLKETRSGEFHGQTCIYMVATYLAPGSGRKYLQIQVITQFQDRYYFMAYTAPEDLVQKYVQSYYHAVETFRFYNAAVAGSESSDNESSLLGSIEGALDRIDKSLGKILDDAEDANQ